MSSKYQEPLFQGIRAAFLDESLEEMQYVFRDMGGRVLNLEKGKSMNPLKMRI